MEEKMMNELLQLRSKSLLETFTECAPKHMILFWIHRTDDENTFSAETVLDPLMLAEIHQAIGPDAGDKWCDNVRDILQSAMIKVMRLYAEALCELEEM